MLPANFGLTKAQTAAGTGVGIGATLIYSPAWRACGEVSSTSLENAQAIEAAGPSGEGIQGFQAGDSEGGPEG